MIHMTEGAEVKENQSRYFRSYKLSSLISDEQRQPEMRPTDNREVN